MKEIQLTQGKVAIVDDEDFERVSQYKWYATTNRKRKNLSFYALSQKQCKTIIMHRFILNAPAHLQVDHIDHCGLNNQKSNLRLATNAENSQNRKPQTNNRTGYKGVCFHKAAQKFVAAIKTNKKSLHLGVFDSAIDAAKAYDKKAKELFGEFAALNF